MTAPPRPRPGAIIGVVGLIWIALVLGVGAAPTAARPAAPAHVPEATRVAAIEQLGIVRDSIDETLRLIKEGKAEKALSEAKDGYLSHFEYVEIPLRIVDAELTIEAETKFAEIRVLIDSGASTEEVRTRIIELRRLVDDAERRLTDTGISAPSVVVAQSFVIIFLEGLEAVLLVSVLFGYLESVNATHHRKPILWGMGLALVATVITFFALRGVLAVLPGGEEILEAGMALLAAAMLFYLSFWLIARIEEKRWMEFLRSRVWAAIAAGSTTALMLVGFTAIYREGFETALFYQALLSFGPGLGRWVAMGFGLGVVALSAVAWAVFRLGRRVPVKGFLIAALVVLMSTSVALLGNAIRELQEVDKIGLHRYPDWPQVPIYVRQSLGYWPSRETVVPQLVLTFFYLAVALYMFFIRPFREQSHQRSIGADGTYDPTAVLGRRIDAWTIDLLVYLLLMFVVVIGLGGERFFTHGDQSVSPIQQSDCAAWEAEHTGICIRQDIIDDIEDNGSVQITTVDFGLQMALVVIGPFLAYVVVQGLFGASLGKLAVGLRVVRPDGSLAGMVPSFVRTVGWVGDAMLCGLPIVGGMLMVETEGHRRLGDMAAKTYVVDAADVGRPVVPVMSPTPADDPADPTPLASDRRAEPDDAGGAPA